MQIVHVVILKLKNIKAGLDRVLFLSSSLTFVEGRIYLSVFVIYLFRTKYAYFNWYGTLANSVNSDFPPYSPVIKSTLFKAIKEPSHIHPKSFITFYKQTVVKLNKQQSIPLGLCVPLYFMECTFSLVLFCLALHFFFNWYTGGGSPINVIKYSVSHPVAYKLYLALLYTAIMHHVLSKFVQEFLRRKIYGQYLSCTRSFCALCV